MSTDAQKAQIAKQIAAYRTLGKHHVEIPVGESCLNLTIEEKVASPLVMNSGHEVVLFLEERPELVRGKKVIDMGTGSGIIGLAAAKLGATEVLMPEIDPTAYLCAAANIEANGLGHVCRAIQSDLFSHVPSGYNADVLIFNHPFFTGEPEEEDLLDQVMRAKPALLLKYLVTAHDYAKPDALYLFPWIDLAGNPGEVDNDPGRQAPKAGYVLEEQFMQEHRSGGEQGIPFVIYLFRYNAT